MDFDSLDFDSVPAPTGSRKRAPITAAQFTALAAPQVPCGFFTLTLTDGAQKRFRVRLERGTFMTGQRTLSRYCKIESGDDVEREWETIAVVAHEGFRLFKRWRGEWEEKWASAIWDILNGTFAKGYNLEIEPRCWMCMRKLASAEQLAAGLTPGCTTKLFPKPKR